MTVPVDNRSLDWPRKVANGINDLLRRVGLLEPRMTAVEVENTLRADYPFTPLDTAPASPTDGLTYFDTTLGKARTWAGGMWNDFW